MYRRSALAALSFALFLMPFAAFAQSPSASDSANAARMVVHLLDYLAKDYGGAVQGGKVLNEAEYAEQVEFAGTVQQNASAVPAIADSPALKSDLKRLGDLITAKAEPDAVSALARQLQRDVVSATGLPLVPSRWPDQAKAAQLFAANCASCHGAGGAGDGPAGTGLEPPPANFLDLDAMAALSPSAAFNTILLGVPGTGMISFQHLDKDDLWSLSAYVVSLRHRQGKFPPYGSEAGASAGDGRASEGGGGFSQADLERVSLSSDAALLGLLPGDAAQKARELSRLRLHSVDADRQDTLGAAIALLRGAADDYRGGRGSDAKQKALQAYLDGIEPVEPKLRANAGELVAELEARMTLVRSAIDAGEAHESVAAKVDSAIDFIGQARARLARKPDSALSTGLLAGTILFREGFEAALVIVAFLGVLRATGATRARRWIHGGWIAAVAVGVAGWFASGALSRLSGAHREYLEGGIALIAVAMLLYMGFWLHSKTNMRKWQEFISGSMRKALEGGGRVGLAGIAFIAVFREAFETVLFLRAISLDGGEGAGRAMGIGVALGSLLIVGLCWALVRFSRAVPVRQLFTVSSALMALLSVMLLGKGLHSLQETGAVPVTALPLQIRWDLLGVYPTLETLSAQIVLVAFVALLWGLARRDSAAPVPRGPSPSVKEGTPK